MEVGDGQGMILLPSRVSVVKIAMESIYSYRYNYWYPKFNDNKEKTVCKIVKICTKKLNLFLLVCLSALADSCYPVCQISTCAQVSLDGETREQRRVMLLDD